VQFSQIAEVLLKQTSVVQTGEEELKREDI
jgi:hypothetical protein